MLLDFINITILLRSIYNINIKLSVNILQWKIIEIFHSGRKLQVGSNIVFAWMMNYIILKITEVIEIVQILIFNSFT